MKKEQSELLKAVSHIVKAPSKQMWVDYDEEADVLYMSFEKPQRASDSEMVSKNVILRKRKNKIVGMTILHAKKFRHKH